MECPMQAHMCMHACMHTHMHMHVKHDKHGGSHLQLLNMQNKTWMNQDNSILFEDLEPLNPPTHI